MHIERTTDLEWILPSFKVIKDNTSKKPTDVLTEDVKRPPRSRKMLDLFKKFQVSDTKFPGLVGVLLNRVIDNTASWFLVLYSHTKKEELEEHYTLHSVFHVQEHYIARELIHYAGDVVSIIIVHSKDIDDSSTYLFKLEQNSINYWLKEQPKKIKAKTTPTVTAPNKENITESVQEEFLGTIEVEDLTVPSSIENTTAGSQNAPEPSNQSSEVAVSQNTIQTEPEAAKGKSVPYVGYQVSTESNVVQIPKNTNTANELPVSIEHLGRYSLEELELLQNLVRRKILQLKAARVSEEVRRHRFQGWSPIMQQNDLLESITYHPKTSLKVLENTTNMVEALLEVYK